MRRSGLSRDAGGRRGRRSRLGLGFVVHRSCELVVVLHSNHDQRHQLRGRRLFLRSKDKVAFIRGILYHSSADYGKHTDLYEELYKAGAVGAVLAGAQTQVEFEQGLVLLPVQEKLDALDAALSSMDDASPEFQRKQKDWNDNARDAFKRFAELLVSPDLEGSAAPSMENTGICGQDWQVETIDVANKLVVV